MNMKTKTNPATQAYVNSIESVDRDLNRIRKYKASLVAHRKQLGKVARMLANALKPTDSLFISNDFDGKPYICLSLSNLESFKCLELEIVLNTLLNIGEPGETSDWASALNRDYKFKLGAIDVVVSAYVRDDSPTCKRIVVGTEMRQVDTYKIVCE
jgi:hypothetical protein